MAGKGGPAAALKASGAGARKLAEQVGPSRTEKLLRRAQRDLERRLREAEGLANADGEEAFTPTQLRATLAQVKHVLRELKPGLRDVVVDGGREAAERQASATVRYLDRADRAYRGTAEPIDFDRARVVDRAVAGTESSILRRVLSDPDHPGRLGVLDRYGESVVGRFEDELQAAFVSRKPFGEVVKSIREQSEFLQGAPAYWATRLVRTESMHASNRASWETIRGADEQLGDMLKILSSVFDSRTGADSVAAHGQIRRPEEAFESWFGAFQHPPDRPNDRGVVVPHRMSWPLPPALLPMSDGDVASAWRREGRKGAPPGRPLMSTVDVRLIGR